MFTRSEVDESFNHLQQIEYARRDGWVVEGSGLENRQGGNLFEGSNPSLSAHKNENWLYVSFYFCEWKDVNSKDGVGTQNERSECLSASRGRE